MDSLDTSTEARDVLVAGWRALSARQRMELVEAWSADVRALAEQGVRTRHPTADDEEVRLMLGRLLYGADVIDDDVEQAVRGSAVTPGALTLTVLVCRLLDDLRIDHVVGGSVASSLVGEPRATLAVDIAVALRADAVPALVEALSGEWYVSGDAAREAVRRRASFNVIHLETMQKVDLFVLGEDVLDINQLARRQRVEVAPGTSLWIGSPEDQVLRKLWWFQMGGEVSERQWRDVVAILRIQGERVDDGYLRAVAGQVGLLPLILRAQDQV